MLTETPAHTIREREAARYLDMSVAWLRQGRMRGRGPSYIRAGRAIRYRTADLDAWLQAHRVETRDTRAEAGGR
jgi:predicted DNA-binding transcriptional regulator AlpA